MIESKTTFQAFNTGEQRAEDRVGSSNEAHQQAQHQPTSDQDNSRERIEFAESEQTSSQRGWETSTIPFRWNPVEHSRFQLSQQQHR